jgi:hypothetical protein
VKINKRQKDGYAGHVLLPFALGGHLGEKFFRHTWAGEPAIHCSSVMDDWSFVIVADPTVLKRKRLAMTNDQSSMTDGK